MYTFPCGEKKKIPFSSGPQIPRPVSWTHPGIPFKWIISWSCALGSDSHTDIPGAPRTV